MLFDKENTWDRVNVRNNMTISTIVAISAAATVVN